MTHASEDVLKDYRKWLYAVAKSWRADEPDTWDDLAQEGYIAMWRALKTYDPNKGSLPSWLTTAAKMRMRDVIRRGVQLGKPSRRGQYAQQDPTPADPTWGWMHEIVGTPADAIESTMLAYHDGDFAAAFSELSPKDREYLYTRFWKMQPDRASDWRWKYIKPKLRASLAHLAEV